MITSSIVLYNTDRNELKRVIESASNSIIDKIYVLDNSPNDNLKEYVEGLSHKVLYIYNGKNLGYGGGHNIALKKSIDIKANYHIVLNPDIFFKDEVITTLKKYMDENKNAGAIMPQIRYPDNKIQYLCKLQPTPFDLLGRRFIPVRCITNKLNFKYELRMSGYDKVMNVPCLSGCFMFLRVNILKETGLFDENFFMYCEDFDFYRRIHQKYETVFYPHVEVIHDHKKESYKNKKMLFAHIKSAIYYFNKWGWFSDTERKYKNKIILDKLYKNA